MSDITETMDAAEKYLDSKKEKKEEVSEALDIKKAFRGIENLDRESLDLETELARYNRRHGSNDPFVKEEMKKIEKQYATYLDSLQDLAAALEVQFKGE